MLEGDKGPCWGPRAGWFLYKDDIGMCFVGLLEDRLVRYILLIGVMLDKLNRAIRATRPIIYSLIAR